MFSESTLFYYFSKKLNFNVYYKISKNFKRIKYVLLTCSCPRMTNHEGIPEYSSTLRSMDVITEFVRNKHYVINSCCIKTHMMCIVYHKTVTMAL